MANWPSTYPVCNAYHAHSHANFLSTEIILFMHKPETHEICAACKNASTSAQAGYHCTAVF